MTNTASRGATGALVPGLFNAVGGAVSIAPAHADPAYDQKCRFRIARRSFGPPSSSASTWADRGPTWKVGYHLMKDQGWTESQTSTFIQGPVPTYRPNAWG